MGGFFKKTLGICLIGFGVGTLMVILLPITGWQLIIGISVTAIGFMWLKS